MKKSHIVILSCSIGILVTLAVGAFLLYQYVVNKPSPKPYDNISIIAHRGGSEEYTENTLKAFQFAVEQGVEWIEFDVQQTSDSQLVVFHDDSLMRRYNYNKPIYQTTYRQVSVMSCGEVPTLDEVLQFCAGKINMCVEVKENELTGSRPIMERVIRKIQKYDATDSVKVISRYVPSLHTAKSICGDIQTVWLYDVPQDNIPYYDEMIDTFSVAKNIITMDIIKAAHNAGKTIDVWTVDDPADARRIIQDGADSIITNTPVHLRSEIGA